MAFTPFTLAQLRAAARKRADMEGLFFEDDDLNTLLNQGYSELYDLLVTIYEDYFTASTEITVLPNVDTYDLSAVDPAVKKIRGVELVLSSAEGDVAPIPKFEFSERGRYAGAPDFARRRTGSALRYLFFGQQLKFVPVPSGERTVRLWYIPRVEPLRDADPTAMPPITAVDVHSVVEPGWEKYIILSAAIAMLQTEESDVSQLEREMARVVDNIRGSAPSRDADAPSRMIRRAPFDGGGDGFGGAGDGGWVE